ncbi:MAG: hypothetical protein LCH35_13350 [Bacteroidetes bacterium]|uniref:hypothetical protein n=1 Tax=Flavobacterium sp. TaxID=239 RepID=UPI002FDB48C3|nr:hypothetical protein [Bacteroidota bacterium]
MNSKKVKKYNRIFIVLLFLNTMVSAQNKTITPKNGTISFKVQEIITDSLAYRASNKKMLKDMFLVHGKSLKEEMETKDTLQLNQMIEEFSKSADFFFEELTFNEPKENKSVVMIYYKDSINYHWTNDYGVIGSENIINIKAFPEPQTKFRAAIQKLIENNDDVYSERKEYDYYYSNNKIIEIKENKKETKKVNGFDCFKVIYTFIEDGLDETDEFANFMKKYPQTREIWVTNKIKSPFHPIVREKEIIEKYYPLEIKQYSKEFKGIEENYTITTFSLSN